MIVDLKLTTGRVVTWEGRNAEDAARRYVDWDRGAVVVATRRADRHGLHVGIKEIVEPDQKGWRR